MDEICERCGKNEAEARVCCGAPPNGDGCCGDGGAPICCLCWARAEADGELSGPSGDRSEEEEEVRDQAADDPDGMDVRLGRHGWERIPVEVLP